MGKIADANRRARGPRAQKVPIPAFGGTLPSTAFVYDEEKTDCRVDLSEVSVTLLAVLRNLGASYGPLGVARAAAALTSIDVLIRNLGGVVPADDQPVITLKSWATSEILTELGAMHDELDRRGVDLNEQPEYTQSGYTEGDAKRTLAGDRVAEKRLIDSGIKQIVQEGPGTERKTTFLSDWTKEIMAAKPIAPAPCPTLRRTLEAVALRAARLAIAEHLGED